MLATVTFTENALLLFLAAQVCLWYTTVGQMTLTVDKTNAEFVVSVEDNPVLNGGDIFTIYDGNKYSVSGGSLVLDNVTEASGQDTLGKWTADVFNFHLKMPSKNPAIGYRVIFQTYQDHPTFLFGQHFLSEISNASTGNQDMLASGFPCMTVDPSTELGYLAYGGIMFGDTAKTVGSWPPDSKGIHSGLDSGPLVLFDEDQHSGVISSFSNVMAGSAVYTSQDDDTVACWGVMGMAEKIPKDFSYWTILHYSDQGINANMESWGELMRKYYNKKTQTRDSDFINNYIGYWTDNGAYYYYITEPGKNYEDTILDVYAYSVSLGIPYRYVQYDSWWYPKGSDGGVTEWIPLKSVFPSGLQYLWQKTGWPVIAHNRWWSSETKYAKKNGGHYDFIVENVTRHSVPVDQKFWEDLLETSKEWGLLTYEQDWLNTEFDDTNALRKNVTMGRTWLMQMGKAAANNGMTIQYCMSPSRHALQSLEIPAVTQARVSGDYQPGNDQWKIGISSIFAHQMGVTPYKDNFWTTQNQTGNLYHKSEPFPELQSVVATLSTGPVGPSDKIGHSDAKLIMRSCNSDGLILKPDRPAMAIDQQLQMRAFDNFMGEVWSTWSMVSGWPFGILFGADFAQSDSLYITPMDIFGSQQVPDSMIFSAAAPTKLMNFSDSAPLQLSGCSKAQFCLYHTTPVLQFKGKQLIFHGELDKWVPMSSKRVAGIYMASDDITIKLVGGVAEKVTFTYVYDTKVVMQACVLSQAGSAVVSVASQSCS